MLRPFFLSLFTQVFHGLARPPRSYENEQLPRLFSHQQIMALLAGPPRNHENELVVVAEQTSALLGAAKKPVHQHDVGVSGTPNCRLREHAH